MKMVYQLVIALIEPGERPLLPECNNGTRVTISLFSTYALFFLACGTCIIDICYLRCRKYLGYFNNLL